MYCMLHKDKMKKCFLEGKSRQQPCPKVLLPAVHVSARDGFVLLVRISELQCDTVSRMQAIY